MNGKLWPDASQERDIPEIDLQPVSNDAVVKREVGSFRYRDRFWYPPTTTTTTAAAAARSLSNFDSESDDDRVDIVTPAPGK